MNKVLIHANILSNVSSLGSNCDYLGCEFNHEKELGLARRILPLWSGPRISSHAHWVKGKFHLPYRFPSIFKKPPAINWKCKSMLKSYYNETNLTTLTIVTIRCDTWNRHSADGKSQITQLPERSVCRSVHACDCIPLAGQTRPRSI